MKSKRIIHQLYLLIIVLFLFALFNLAAIYTAIDRTTADGRMINFAGIVRGKSQRIIKLELVQQPADSQISEVEQIVRGLVNGSKTLGLPAAQNPTFQAQIVAMEGGWKRLSLEIQRWRSQSIQGDRLLQESETFWELANAAVFAAETLAKENINFSKKVAIVIFIANFILLVIIALTIRKIVLNLQQTVRVLASSSNQIAITLEENERTINQQAETVNNTNMALAELEISAQTTAQQAKHSSDRAADVFQLVQAGRETADKTLSEMSILQAWVEAIATQMQQLNQQITRIATISQMVKELAAQTNSLALNAAIEAIRAEAYGAEFAVIAKEIRQLADRSKQSGEQINDLVKDIQKAIDLAVQATISGKETVWESSKKVQIDRDRFQPMTEAIAEVAENSRQISQIVSDQVKTISQAVREMNALDRGTQENAIGIGQTKIAIQYLQDISLMLKAMV
ncbi:methyl-accepting chemotaxis protein [Spirulina sp. 06S082]|uniref:methyl-accepting chemotaxis protein n=1 Tax=Spirulina sp. 06S082 TaxID=3110248 RepID=UPI002B1FC621|nr:methyl-accepting chemotaxis protein [Spirulina sp. 06S082]MEA5467959.1 methyl-accepting chemotaxis protein [Spirulina sp. 06S082]